MSVISDKLVRTHKYKNGFTLVYQKTKNVLPITAMNILCNLGSVYENDDTRGVSHFIEHMIFKGTRKVPLSRDLFLTYDRSGADFNASTNKRYTEYTLKCRDEYLEKVTIVLADMLLHSIFDKNEYKKEYQVVVEENLNDANDDEIIVSDKVDEVIYQGSPYQNPVDNIKYHNTPNTFTRTRVLDIYQKYYVPSNMLVSVVSNKSFDYFVKLFAKTCLCSRDIHQNCKQPLPTLVVPTQTAPQYNLLSIPLQDVLNISISFRVCSQTNDDKYPLNLLRQVLGGFFSSRLFMLLREDNGLTYSSSVHSTYYENTGDFTISAKTDHRKWRYNGSTRKKGVLPIIIEMLRDIVENGVHYNELTLAKNYHKSQHILNMEDIENIANYNGERALVYNETDGIVSYEDIYENKYKNITLQMLNAVIKKYIKLANMNVCIAGKHVPSLKVLKEECEKLGV
jgi:predicted Zn-dependent peptidase